MAAKRYSTARELAEMADQAETVVSAAVEVETVTVLAVGADIPGGRADIMEPAAAVPTTPAQTRVIQGGQTKVTAR